MGYPELATGDAYKALVLVRKSRNPHNGLAGPVKHHLKIAASSTEAQTGLQGSTTEQGALLTLVRSLLLANCLQESLDYALAAVSKYPENTELKSSLAMVQNAYDRDQLESQTDNNLEGMTALEEDEYRRAGHILSQSYPWMDAKLFARGADVTAAVQHNFHLASWGQCKLEQSLVREGMPIGDRSERFSDVLGVTATKDLMRNEMLLVDHTAVSAVDDPLHRCTCCCGILTANFTILQCCSARCCSRYCADRALATYHLAVCGKDLSRFENAYTKNLATPAKAADDLLLLRVLACAVQHSSTHPLNTPFVKQLTAMYDGKKHQPFDCETNIIGTFKMLTSLGIDIFANHNFDTWVLQSLRARIGNNSREYSIDGHTHIAINPLYSFFNHSCDPNIKWEDDGATHSSTSRMYSVRSVSEGEERFINYREELFDEPVSVRREMLREWLASDCQCDRCVDEEAANGLRNPGSLERQRS